MSRPMTRSSHIFTCEHTSAFPFHFSFVYRRMAQIGWLYTILKRPCYSQPNVFGRTSTHACLWYVYSVHVYVLLSYFACDKLCKQDCIHKFCASSRQSGLTFFLSPSVFPPFFIHSLLFLLLIVCKCMRVGFWLPKTILCTFEMEPFWPIGW